MEQSARAALSKDLARLKDGDRAAARPVFDTLWPALVSFARRSLDDDHHAEEAAQRALVRLFGQVHRYDVERDALSWAFALTVWEVRSLRRDRSRASARTVPLHGEHEHHHAHHHAPIASACEAPDDLVVDRELRMLLDDMLATLNDIDRRALLEMLRDTDPAAPLSARWRQRRHRALAKLRTMWKELYGTP